MTQTPLFIPHDRRTTVFFWLGIILLPVFWAWFTLGKSFARWQRASAFTLAAGQVFLFWYTFPQMTDRYAAIDIGFPAILICLTLGLFAWLMIRVSNASMLDLFVVFITLGQPIMFLRTTIDIWGAAGFFWYLAIMPLAPALFILAADPERRVFKQVAALVRRR